MKWDNVIKNSLNRFDIWDLGTAPLTKHVWNNLSHKCHISTVITQRFAHFVTLALDHRHVECSCFVDKAREHTKFVGWKDSLARTTLDPVGNNPHLLKGGKGTTIRKAWSEPFLSLKQKIQMLEACDLSLETSNPCFRQDARPLMRQMKRLSWTFREDWDPHCDPDAEDAPYHVRFARSWIVFTSQPFQDSKLVLTLKLKTWRDFDVQLNISTKVKGGERFHRWTNITWTKRGLPHPLPYYTQGMEQYQR